MTPRQRLEKELGKVKSRNRIKKIADLRRRLYKEGKRETSG